MRRVGGIVLTMTGFLACPCHLILTLPLLLSLLAGTALGSFLSQNSRLVYARADIYFVVALALGGSLLSYQKRPGSQSTPPCPICTLGDAPESESWRSSSSEDQPLTRR
jgi:hypothetical protein